MRVQKLVVLFFYSIFFSTAAISQNVSINVLTQKSGVIRVDEPVFFEVTINNTDASSMVGVYKLKAQINIADPGIIIENAGHNLPTGWQIISNTGNVITLSNGKDIIAPSDSRTLLIALKGKKIGGSVSIAGQLSFSNGVAPGTEPGSLNGDNPVDNFSKSSCKVINE